MSNDYETADTFQENLVLRKLGAQLETAFPHTSHQVTTNTDDGANCIEIEALGEGEPSNRIFFVDGNIAVIDNSDHAPLDLTASFEYKAGQDLEDVAQEIARLITEKHTPQAGIEYDAPEA